MRHWFTNCRFLHSLAMLSGLVSVCSASEPPVAPPPKSEDKRPTVTVTLKKEQEILWRLGRNSVIGKRVTADDGQKFTGVLAVDVSGLDSKARVEHDSPLERSESKTSFAMWSQKFDDPDLKITNGYSSVVDEKNFGNLRIVRGQDADKLNRDGVVVGRVKAKKYDALKLAHFLIATGIVDANIHIEATITGEHYSSDAGHWFKLHSDDPFWTNRTNRVQYNFGLHIGSDGTIRLINAAHVGQLLTKREDKAE
jgi:hypothetical protein